MRELRSGAIDVLADEDVILSVIPLPYHGTALAIKCRTFAADCRQHWLEPISGAFYVSSLTAVVI